MYRPRHRRTPPTAHRAPTADRLLLALARLALLLLDGDAP